MVRDEIMKEGDAKKIQWQGQKDFICQSREASAKERPHASFIYCSRTIAYLNFYKSASLFIVVNSVLKYFEDMSTSIHLFLTFDIYLNTRGPGA